jgi:ectoine hydroxylase-related dioxygenase (phytanoyl-CoA dioxygenase family)
MALHPEQLWCFECRGFLVIPSLIEEAVVTRIRSAADRLHSGSSYAQYSPIVDKDPAFGEGIFHPAIERISAQFFGGEFTIKQSILVVNPRLSAKGPGNAGPHWHRDMDHGTHQYYATAWPCPLFQLRIIIALTPVSAVESGGLAFLSGSHRSKGEFPYSVSSMPPEMEIPRMDVGDCLIMHHATYHTALPNLTQHDRMSVHCISSPNWVRSKEEELLSREFIANMPDDRRHRLRYPKW